MEKMVFGLFDSANSANNALGDLYTAGITKDDVSLILEDRIAKEAQLQDAVPAGEQAVQGAAAGAATGAAIGALGGFLVGVGAIVVPGIGALLLAGPIATTLGLTGAVAAATTGAVGGAVAGGLVGSLVRLGLPEEKALVYQDKIKAGNILVAVKTDTDEERQTVENVLQKHAASEINYYSVT